MIGTLCDHCKRWIRDDHLVHQVRSHPKLRDMRAWDSQRVTPETTLPLIREFCSWTCVIAHAEEKP